MNQIAAVGLVMCAAVLLAGSCATSSTPASSYPAKFAKGCVENGLPAQQCTCVERRMPQTFTADELEYLETSDENPTKASEMEASNPELSGIANRLMVLMMGTCGPDRG